MCGHLPQLALVFYNDKKLPKELTLLAVVYSMKKEGQNKFSKNIEPQLSHL